MYADNHKKVVAILNEKVPINQLLNALGHCTLGLAEKVGYQLAYKDYRASDLSSHGLISTYPYIILKSSNSNQINTLREQCREENIPYCDFVETMLGISADDQIKKTLSISSKDCQYFCLVMFGDSSMINPYIKKFSLRK